MFLKQQNFSHNAEDLMNSLGFSRNTQLKCRERILFACMSNSLQGIELYGDNDEDVPPQFHSKTGDLQRVLSMIEDQQEYEFTLMFFLKYQEMATQALKRYLLKTKISDDSMKAKLDIMFQLEDLKYTEDAKDSGKEKKENNFWNTSPKNLLKRCETIIKTKYNWSIYYNAVSNQDFVSNSDFNVDDLLKKIIEN